MTQSVFHCWRSIAVAVIAAVAVFAANEQAADARAFAKGSHFSWEEFLPDRRVDRQDWSETVRAGHLATFNALRTALVTNSISSASASGFRLVLDAETMQRVEPLLTDLEGPARSDAIEHIYAELMRAPSSRDVLLEKLQDILASAFRHVEKNADDNGRHIGWAVASATYASLMAFKNTDDMRFIELASDALDRALSYRDSEIGRIDPFRGRAMQSWGGSRYTEDGRYSTNVTLAGRVAFVLALFAETARENAKVAELYGTQADSFIEAAKKAMDEYAPEFQLTQAGDMGYYIRPTHGGDIEPLNHMAWAGNALILLGKLTNEPRYNRMAEQLARFFRHCMRTDKNGSLYWRYQPTHEDYYGRATEWVWKARITSQFVYFAWQRNIVFTDEDARGVTKMLLTNVFRPDGTTSARIDAKFRDMEDFKGFRGNYLSTTPFIVFEDVAPTLGARIEDLVATRPDIGGWMHNRHGIVAYAHRLGRSAATHP